MDDVKKSFHTVSMISVPWITDMYFVIVIINDEIKFPVLSDFHLQILFTRILIFSETTLMASPVFQCSKQIYVIINKPFYESGKLDTLLHEHHLQCTQPIIPNINIYNDCLKYTIIARISPQWNQVDGYLVEGQEFLLNRTVLNAVKVDVNITEGKAHLSTEACRVRLPEMNLEALNCVRNHFTGSRYTIDSDFYVDLSSEVNYVYVLPSLKRGRVIAVSKKIPSNSPFKSYDDIRDHWKKMYGYELPNTDENMLYYTIVFFVQQRNLLTYPEVCVRRCDMVFVSPNIDYHSHHSILRRFETDIRDKFFYAVRGSDQVDIKYGYFNHHLQTANESTRENWSENTEENCSKCRKLNMCDESCCPSYCGNNAMKRLPESPAFVPLQTSETVTNLKYYKESVFNQSEKQYNIDFQRPNPVVPIFQKKIPSFEVPQNNLSTFCKQESDDCVDCAMSEFNCENQTRFKPVFGIQKTGKTTKYARNIFIPSNRGTVSKTTTKNSSTCENKFRKLENAVTSGTNFNVNVQKKESVKNSITGTLSTNREKLTSLSKTFVPIQNTNTTIEFSFSRENKKNKPLRPVETVDIELAARSGTLRKISNANLLQYLRDRQVPCRIKDRKEQLIEKVINCIHGRVI